MRKVWQSIFAQATNFTALLHPDYANSLNNWVKYRFTFEGGHDFVEEYLKQFSTKENTIDFVRRKEITYCPAFAKAAVMDIKNAIYQRLVDIKRENGSQSYMAACKGEDNGVDFDGNSMNSFIGRLILPELLSMAKVGVYIDKEPLDAGISKATAKNVRPYLYMYPAESIRSWSKNKQGVLTALLLQDTMDAIDEQTGLVTGTTTIFRHLTLQADGVHVTFYDNSNKIISDKSMILNLTRIPFVIFELTHSLLVDAADYQIALLQLASSDIHYSWKSNYPFYIEQFDMIAEMSMLRQAEASADAATSSNPGTSAEAQKAKSQGIDLGTRQGRRYPKGLDAPAFIHPSAEPLKASMDKQDQMKVEIRQLVNLALTSVEGRQSAQSKQEDTKSLEAGLSYIGLELEYGERLIATIWNEYENYATTTIVAYPTNYSLKTDTERRQEAKELREELPKIPSKTYQQEIAKQIVSINLGHKVNNETLKKMQQEIDQSEVVVTDPDIIKEDHDAGFVSTDLASRLRGYPTGEVAKAKIDHAERLARIALSQSDPESRGLKDLSGNPKAGKDEKDKAGLLDNKGTPADPTRGKGK